jgi:hypothetical protein
MRICLFFRALIALTMLATFEPLHAACGSRLSFQDLLAMMASLLCYGCRVSFAAALQNYSGLINGIV